MRPMITSTQRNSIPDYSVRVSTRAKRLQLRIKPTGCVEVVLPQGMSRKHIPGFVAQHADWIQHNLKQLRIHNPTHQETTLPETIHFPACDERWQLEVNTNQRTTTTLRAYHKTRGLHISGPTPQAQCAALQRWLSERAKHVLVPWLEKVSKEIGLPFNRVSVRAQKTRWGSCSSRKNINLNRALLFAEADTVRYLFIHELCHTVHLNHSPQYWDLVASKEPNYKQHEARLNQLARQLPLWTVPLKG